MKSQEPLPGPCMCVCVCVCKFSKTRTKRHILVFSLTLIVEFFLSDLRNVYGITIPKQGHSYKTVDQNRNLLHLCDYFTKTILTYSLEMKHCVNVDI